MWIAQPVRSRFARLASCSHLRVPRTARFRLTVNSHPCHLALPLTRRLARFATALSALWVFAAEPASAASTFEVPTHSASRSRLDEIVQADLASLSLSPAPACSDAVFVRRAFLDVIGTLPTAEEARTFLADRAPDKRAALIDRLLAREEFADYWAMLWSDTLRVKAEFPINLWPNAAQCYHRWIRDAMHDGLPLDQFARELLTANGSNFRVGPANFWRASANRQPTGLARVVAITFLGERVETWPAEKLAAFAPLFSQIATKPTREWKEEIVFFDPSLPAPPVTTRFPDGSVATVAPTQDPRSAFADWLLRAENPVFARALANRIWSWVFGRGIVHPADDFRADNPPANPALLDHLATSLVAQRYDLRSFLREMLNSQTYQSSSLAPTDDPRAEAHFAFYVPRRLDAEVLADAINQVTGTNENYTSAIPEPFTFIPAEQRAISLPDGSITSAFLEKFGRPTRDNGELAERTTTTTTAAQRLHLLNSTHIQRKLTNGPALTAVLRRKQPIEELYLTFLSRPPTPTERDTANRYLRDHPQPRRAGVDIAWALLNSDEFLLRH